MSPLIDLVQPMAKPIVKPIFKPKTEILSIKKKEIGL